MKISDLSSAERKKIVVKYSWRILEEKLKYYHPEYGKAISDEKYDKMELIYKTCCKLEGLVPSASNNVGFPFDTPSGRLVVENMGSKKVTLNKTTPKRRRRRPNKD